MEKLKSLNDIVQRVRKEHLEKGGNIKDILKKELKKAEAWARGKFDFSKGNKFENIETSEDLALKIKAKKHLDSSLVIRLQRNDTYGITDTYLYLGDLFYAKKEFQEEGILTPRRINTHSRTGP